MHCGVNVTLKSHCVLFPMCVCSVWRRAPHPVAWVGGETDPEDDWHAHQPSEWLCVAVGLWQEAVEIMECDCWTLVNVHECDKNLCYTALKSMVSQINKHNKVKVNILPLLVCWGSFLLPMVKTGIYEIWDSTNMFFYGYVYYYCSPSIRVNIKSSYKYLIWCKDSES